MKPLWQLIAFYAPTRRMRMWGRHRLADTLPPHLRYLGHVHAEFGDWK